MFFYFLYDHFSLKYSLLKIGKKFRKFFCSFNFCEKCTLKLIVIEIINYLFSLKTDDEILISNSRRKSFLCGLAIAAKSILNVAEVLFRENAYLKYLLTYRFS